MSENYIDTDSISLSANNIATSTAKMMEVLNNINTDMTAAQNGQVWLGNTSDAVFRKYDELKENYEAISISMEHIINYLNGVSNAYVEWDAKMKELADNSDLDINNK